jgi:hypothetical protein
MEAAACVMVYKTGGVYYPEYVRRLAKVLKENGAQKIFCLSDDPSVACFCEHVPLKYGWPGWWSKLEVFRMVGKYVYFDLDTLILKDITPLLTAEYPNFTMLRDFNKGRGASGVMAWDGNYSYLMKGFDTKQIPLYKSREAWGDQDWINGHLEGETDFFQDRFPGMIASRKLGNEQERAAASVLCYHGNPRPHMTGWAA